MSRMRLPRAFVQMVEMFFKYAAAIVCINGFCTDKFPIHHGVRQGCILASYLFLLVAEALSTVVNQAMTAGRLRGITLSDGSTQQTFFQFADDTSLSLRGHVRNLREASTILQDFGDATRLILNNKECSLYWFASYTPQSWLTVFGCRIAPSNTLSKLLGTPFGISLATTDVDLPCG